MEKSAQQNSQPPSLPRTPKRILFVDDEPAILEVYKLLLEPMSADWEISLASSGQAGLALFKKHSFDVVISDMRMPGMNGIEFLSHVLECYPKTARLILSGYADQEEVAGSIGAAHQFMTKPCDLVSLKGTLSRICALDVFLKNEALQALASQMKTVPSVPMVYYRLVHVLQTPDTSIEEIGALVAQDPSLTAKLLQLVNSAFFGFSRHISDPAEVVQMLGINTIRSLVLCLHAFSCFEKSPNQVVSIGELWNHSISTGHAARQITQLAQAGPPAPDEAFVAGLLHDLGIIMLATNMPVQYQEAVALAREESIELWQAEQRVFGASHADIGAYLLGLWGLPVPIVEAVAFHHHPGRATHRNFTALTAVHIANVFQQQNFPLREAGRSRAEEDWTYLNEVGVKEFLLSWHQKVVAKQQLAA